MITQKQAEKLAKKCTVNVRKWNNKKWYIDSSDKFLYRHGFNYQDTFNLDTSILAYILPRLTFFRDHCTGYPGTVESYDAWIETLNKIIDGFYAYMGQTWKVVNPKEMDEIQEQFNESMQLFAKHFCSLWD